MSVPFARIKFVSEGDFTQLRQKTKEEEQRAQRATTAMITNIRQAAQIGIFTAQAMGFMIDQTLTLTIEALLIGIEAAVAINTALVSGTTGIGFLKIGAQLGTVTAMIILIYQIKTKQRQAASRTAGVVGGLRLVTYR